MKSCHCNSLMEPCIGEVNRYKIYSPSENTTYPNRFWGVVDYCEAHKTEDERQGFLLLDGSQEKQTYVL